MAAGDDNLAVLKQYLAHLRDNDFEAAASQFTEDVHYRRPPLDGVYEMRGRAELLDFFETVRGEREIEHDIVASVAEEDRCAVVISVDGGRELVVSYAEFDDGKISFYLGGRLGKGKLFADE